MIKTILALLDVILPLFKQNSQNAQPKKDNVVPFVPKPKYDIKWIPSPNFKKGKSKKNEVIVIHHTAGASFESDIRWLCDPKTEASAHYIISKKGEIAQLVKDEDIAWHAGKSIFNNVANVNRYSIGIELQGDTCKESPTEKQYKALEYLTKLLIDKYNIPLSNIVAHRDIAPGRKLDVDPANFDWERFLANLN